MSRLVTIFGGSGFVGRYIARRAAQAGWRVRVAVRRPNEAIFVKPYGTVGQVEPVFCNIRDDASVAAAMAGADAVVNAVGIKCEVGKNSFDALHTEGAARIARLSGDAGVERLVHVSAIGADPESQSAYGVTKAAGEARVLEHRPDAVILRPSIVFGPEDDFFNRFARMARMAPILPLVSGNTRFQPVYVDDVAKAAMAGIEGSGEPCIYQLGGPEIMTFRALLEQMLEVINRRRVLVPVPGFVAKTIALGFDVLQFVTMDLIRNNILTRDQLRLLKGDIVVAEEARGLDDLGIEPVAMGSVLPEYLWRFRPSGQYDAIKESARNLRT